MSAYVFCPKCQEESLDTDTLHCDCGYFPGWEAEQERAKLREQIAALTAERDEARALYRGSLGDKGFTDWKARAEAAEAALAEALVALERKTDEAQDHR